MFRISSISELESLSESVKWQYFEKLVAFICEENDFKVQHNVVLTGLPGKRQYDVIAKKFNITFLLECKKWRSRKEAQSAIASAARKHNERCIAYSMKTEENVFPVIVTLRDEDVIDRNGVVVVPVLKLNWFLNNFEKF